MMEWLSGLLGESTANIVGFVLIFAIILCGIFIVLALIRRLTGGSFTVGGRNAAIPRLSVVDAAAVDAKRRLVLIRRDNVEHLLLIGGPTDVVVEQNISKEVPIEVQAVESRIEPEQIERFRQSEAIIATSREQTIQLNSPIEQPVVAEETLPPEPLRSEVSTPSISQPVPVSPVAPVAPRTVEQQVQPAQATINPRQAPSYPPQPRRVMPAKPADQSKTAQLHPAYPLSQVSRGVLTSTSGATTAAQTPSPSVPAVDLQKVSRAHETFNPKLAQSTRAEPTLDTSVSYHAHDAKTEPAHPEVSATQAASNSQEEVLFDMADFESEILGSLDVSPMENKGSYSIEDEMEKLLGDLTADQKRND